VIILYLKNTYPGHCFSCNSTMQCHCYVCDKPAPCFLWGQGNSMIDHCHASDKEDKWRKLRHSYKQMISPSIVDDVLPRLSSRRSTVLVSRDLHMYSLKHLPECSKSIQAFLIDRPCLFTRAFFLCKVYEFHRST
jgi:hypothetical protein